MNKLLEPGKYVVAVSGGVDSVALLHMLNKEKDLKLVVAHFDHGIRNESSEDAKFVARLAYKLDLNFATIREELGADASEALARERRYKFLENVRVQEKAKAIVTAHHQDDLIETALLNVLRGTKRRGLVSLKSTETIKRPLLNMAKKEILNFARTNKINWREDITNVDPKYKRNQIRKALEHSLTPNKRHQIIELLTKINEQNSEIESELITILTDSMPAEISKNELLQYPDEVALEIVAAWLRRRHVAFDSKTLTRIIDGAKQLQNGSKIDVQQNYYLQVTKDQLVLNKR